MTTTNFISRSWLPGAATPQDAAAAQRAVQDSLAAADSLRSDSSRLDSLLQDVAGLLPNASDIVSDSTDTLGNMGRDVGSTISLLLSGDFAAAFDRVGDLGQFLLINVVPDFLSALLVLVVMYAVYRLFRKGVSRAFTHSAHVDLGLESLLLKTLSVVAWTFIIVMVLAQFSVNVSALLAGLSIAGIAIGFAAKDSLENFISGVTIMIDRPFRVGDQVVVDGTYGTVQEITLRSTRMVTLNNEIMVMPNVLMINQKLTNHAFMGKLRIVVPFGIAYKESPEEARAVVLPLLEGDARVSDIPPPSVAVMELGDSSVDMALRFYTRKTEEEIALKAEYAEKVFYALRKAGIEIPFPHLQLFIDGAKGLRDMPGPAS